MINLKAAGGAREICDVIAKFPAAAEKCYTFFLAPYEFKYTHYAIDIALINHRLEILKWFDESEYEIKYEEQNIKKVLEKDCKDIYDYLGPNSRIIKILDQYAKKKLIIKIEYVNKFIYI